MRFDAFYSAVDVDAETERRITARHPLIDQLNAARGARDDVDFAWIDQVRAAGKALKQLPVIPANYAADEHWPATPTEPQQ